jgi:hypothetical protein
MGVQLAIPETSLVVVSWEEVQRRQEHLTNAEWSKDNAVRDPQKAHVLELIEDRKEADLSLSEEMRQLLGGEGYDEVARLYAKGEYIDGDDVFGFRAFSQKMFSIGGDEEFDDDSGSSTNDEEEDAKKASADVAFTVEEARAMKKAASVAVGAEEYVYKPSAEVPDKPPSKFSVKGFGWVLIMNVFLRMLWVNFCIVFSNRYPAVGLCFISLCFGLLSAGLFFWKPYNNPWITFEEGILTIMFTLICYLGASKTFFQYHQLSDNYEYEIIMCDFWIIVNAIGIIVILALGLIIAFYNKLKKDVLGFNFRRQRLMIEFYVQRASAKTGWDDAVMKTRGHLKNWHKKDEVVNIDDESDIGSDDDH